MANAEIVPVLTVAHNRKTWNIKQFIPAVILNAMRRKANKNKCTDRAAEQLKCSELFRLPLLSIVFGADRMREYQMRCVRWRRVAGRRSMRDCEPAAGNFPLMWAHFFLVADREKARYEAIVRLGNASQSASERRRPNESWEKSVSNEILWFVFLFFSILYECCRQCGGCGG